MNTIEDQTGSRKRQKNSKNKIYNHIKKKLSWRESNETGRQIGGNHSNYITKKERKI